MTEPNPAEALIRNREAVERAFFGRWSSFHDCLVLALRLDAEAPRAPAVEVDILAFTRVEQRGKYFHALDWRCVTLRFHGATDVVLDDFRPQNHIGELKLSLVETGAGVDSQRRVRVELEEIEGCSFALVCDEVEVVAIAPPRPNEALQPTGG